MIGVYKIVSRKDGRVYIGSSQNIEYRWHRHKRALRADIHENIFLQRLWNRYGESEFDFVVIQECAADERLQLEQHYLDVTDSKINILSKSRIGGNRLGISHTEETRAKLSRALTGRKLAPEVVEGMRVRLAGKPTPMEGWNRGKSLTEEHRQRIGMANKGKVRSPEVRARISASMKARKKAYD